MNIDNQKLVIDISTKIGQVAWGNKGDVNSRKLEIYVLQKGIPMDLTGVDVDLYSITPLGKKICDNLTITNAKLGKALYNVPTDITSVQGVTKSVLVFRKGTTQLISFEFEIKINRSIYDENAITSDNKFGMLIDALRVTKEYEDALKDASFDLERKYTDRLNGVDAQLDTIATLKENEEYNIVEFGIKPGTSRDNAPDITNKLKEISSLISFNTGTMRRLYVPKGYYKITDRVDFNRCSIVGDNNATFVLDGANSNIRFTPYGSQSLVYESYIQGVGIVGQNGARVGLTLDRGSQLFTEKVNIVGFDIGMELLTTDISHFIRPTIQSCKIGVVCDSVNGSSFEKGNFWDNEKDIVFKGNNGGITFDCNYFENSLDTFNIDTTNGNVRINGLYIKKNMFAKNQQLNNKVFRIIGTHATNFVSINNITINSNRFYYKNLSQNLIDIDLTGGNSSNNIHFIIKDNHIYNEPFPDGAIIKSIGNSNAQLQILFEDNTTTSSTVNVLAGNGWVTGIDRSGSKQAYYNKVRGELLLDSTSQQTNTESAFGWNPSAKMPRYHDGTSYREIPFRGEYLANSSATDVATLKNDFNNLLQKLRDCRVMKSY